jgi:hypothetical protein
MRGRYDSRSTFFHTVYAVNARCSAEFADASRCSASMHA